MLFAMFVSFSFVVLARDRNQETLWYLYVLKYLPFIVRFIIHFIFIIILEYRKFIIVAPEKIPRVHLGEGDNYNVRYMETFRMIFINRFYSIDAKVN